jgi:hypothetical protein
LRTAGNTGQKCKYKYQFKLNVNVNVAVIPQPRYAGIVSINDLYITKLKKKSAIFEPEAGV